MSWLLWILVIGVALVWLAGRAKPGKGRKGSVSGKTKSRRGTSAKSAEEIAAEIETLAQFKALERRVETAEQASMNPNSESAYERAIERHEILQEALYMAAEKVFSYQFVPYLNLDTPLAILELAYTTVTPSEVEEFRNKTGEDFGEWYPLRGWDEKEPPQSGITGLKRYREIVESATSMEEKAAAVEALAKRSRSFAQQFFNGIPGDGIRDSWTISELARLGVPKAAMFYENGFRTVEAILNVSPNEFRKWKGVGPKTLQAFLDFQAGVTEDETLDVPPLPPSV